MYDDEPGASQKIRSRSASETPKKNNSGVFCCLLSILIIIILFVFVGYCIKKHRNNSFSVNSIRYYAEHPEIKPFVASETITTTDTVN